MMNILILSHEYPPIGGGGANACYFLTREFKRMGHDVQIVTANFQNLSSRENIDGVLVHRVDSVRKAKEHCGFFEMLSFLFKAMPYAKKLHKENTFDICLVFFGIPSGPIGYVLKKEYKLPYMIRFGGGDIPGFQERFVVVYKILEPAIKKIWDDADALIANSRGLKKMALDFYAANDFKVICNGVDVDFFKPTEHEERDRITILFVSRLIERKGLQDFIPQLRWIADHSDKRVEMVIVGDGPYKPTLEALVEENKLGDIVAFAGHKSRKEILPYYQHADIFILPSRKEGMPNVVLEAMACGLPVVMTPCEGAEELIEDNGFVSSMENFAAKVAELINDDKKREEMALKSRNRACSLFSWRQTASDYCKLMDTIVKNTSYDDA